MLSPRNALLLLELCVVIGGFVVVRLDRRRQKQWLILVLITSAAIGLSAAIASRT